MFERFERFRASEGCHYCVKCEGVPFRGSPMDMARDAIVHILKVLCSETGLFPVIIESFGGMDSKGNYTTKVVFQAVA